MWRRIDAWDRVVDCCKIVVRCIVVASGAVHAKAAQGVTKLFLPSPLGRLIVPDAALVGALLSKVVPAAEGTAQILATGVAGIREEAYPAMATAHDATVQVGTVPQNRVQRDVVLTNKRTSAIVLVPSLGKEENLLDAYDKEARLCVMMRMLSFITSSYPLDAKPPRGRTRFFCAFDPALDQLRRTNTPPLIAYSDPISCPPRSMALPAPV